MLMLYMVAKVLQGGCCGNAVFALSVMVANVLLCSLLKYFEWLPWCSKWLPWHVDPLSLLGGCFVIPN